MGLSPGNLRLVKSISNGLKPPDRSKSPAFDSSPKGSTILVEENPRWCRSTGRRLEDSGESDKIFGTSVHKIMSFTSNNTKAEEGSEISQKVGGNASNSNVFYTKISQVKISDTLKNSSRISGGGCSELLRRRENSLSDKLSNGTIRKIIHRRLSSHGEILKVPLVQKNPMLDGKLIKLNVSNNPFFGPEQNSSQISDTLHELLEFNKSRSPVRVKPISTKIPAH